MEKIVAQGMLFDFYGELLTEHQRRIYGDMVYGDLTASEIAKEQGISRQGVHDLMKRCDKILEDYEAKLHLVEKFLQIREIARQIERTADEYGATKDQSLIAKIRELSERITGTL